MIRVAQILKVCSESEPDVMDEKNTTYCDYVTFCVANFDIEQC